MNTPPTKTVLDHLTAEFPRGKRTTFKEMVTDRRVLINNIPAIKLSQPLKSSDRIRILPRGQMRQAPLPPLHPLKLIHEDEDLLVIDKPAGLLTSTVADERRPTVLAIVRRYVIAREPQSPVGLIHRLDRDASGLLVFSKSHRAYKSLKAQFFRHTVDRVYEAIVEGVPNPRKGRIKSQLLERADGSVNSLPRDVHGKGQRAITDYEVVEILKPRSPSGRVVPNRSSLAHEKEMRSILLVQLLTGRKHQIRAHLASRGHPIVGDTVYGASEPGDLQLRAIRLAIEHPATGKRVTFELPRKKPD